jgi:hypothetical protein
MRTALRELLPTRRRNITFDMKFGDQNADYAVTVGYYDDGRIGEVFIDGAKSGSAMSAITHDAATIVSIGLQYGVPIETFRHAISREANGDPATVLGAVLDKINEMENET